MLNYYGVLHVQLKNMNRILGQIFIRTTVKKVLNKVGYEKQLKNPTQDRTLHYCAINTGSKGLWHAFC